MILDRWLTIIIEFTDITAHENTIMNSAVLDINPPVIIPRQWY